MCRMAGMRHMSRRSTDPRTVESIVVRQQGFAVARGTISMTEYAVYLDDGGHPDSQPYLVVAGFAADAKQWSAFVPTWEGALKKLGLSAPFHMTEFMTERLTEFRRDQVLSRLRLVIKRHTLRPFISAIDMAAYRLVQEEFALEETHGAPYALACRALARELHEWQALDLKAEDRVSVFVEEGTKHFGDMEQVFKRDRLPLPTRVPKTTPQAQPSDMLAWEVFASLRAGSPKKMSRNLDLLTRAMRKKQNFGGIFYERDLRNLCTTTRVVPREHLPPGDNPIRFGGGGERKRPRRRTIE
jgi:hypothetical protein